MAYADYSFYQGTYGGKSIPKEEATRLLNKASLILESHAGEPLLENREQVGMACCAVADLLYQEEKSAVSGSSGAVQSESTGAWSISYAAGTVKSIDRRIADEIALYLGPLGVLSQAVPYRLGIPKPDGWRKG